MTIMELKKTEQQFWNQEELALTAISQKLDMLIRAAEDSGRLVYTSAELADKLRVTEKKITEWRQAGAIQGIFKGKAYIYPRAEVDRFLHDYLGRDLSNKFETEASVALVNRRKS